MKSHETPHFPQKQLSMTPELRDLIRRRTLPFLNEMAAHRPLSLLLEEVYLQGIKDAVQAMEKNGPENFPKLYGEERG